MQTFDFRKYPFNFIWISYSDLELLSVIVKKNQQELYNLGDKTN